MPFVFKDFFASFPLFCIFSHASGSPLAGESPTLPRSRTPDPGRDVSGAEKLEFLSLMRAFYNQFEFVLSSFQNSIVCLQ
jgi:hypothetical protein